MLRHDIRPVNGPMLVVSPRAQPAMDLKHLFSSIFRHMPLLSLIEINLVLSSHGDE
jgi:hypothetical protein